MAQQWYKHIAKTTYNGRQWCKHSSADSAMASSGNSRRVYGAQFKTLNSRTRYYLVPGYLLPAILSTQCFRIKRQAAVRELRRSGGSRPPGRLLLVFRNKLYIQAAAACLQTFGHVKMNTHLRRKCAHVAGARGPGNAGLMYCLHTDLVKRFSGFTALPELVIP